MTIWDVLPFVVGAYYLFGRKRKKNDQETPEQSAPKKRPEISLEDVWKQLTDQTAETVPHSPPEEVVQKKKYNPQPVLTEENGSPDYSEYQTRKTMRPDSIGHSLKREKLEKKSYVKSKNIAENFDDPIIHTKTNALHREFDRHLAEEVEHLEAEDIDLRQAIIYEAILNKPRY